jgi:hypothetical protein
LQQSTADIQQNPKGSLKMIMEYDLDLQGGSLTTLLGKQPQNRPPAVQVSANSLPTFDRTA